MDLLSEQFLHRVKLAVQGSRGRDFVPGWLCEHTRHPRDAQKLWSFEGHEFQTAILSCPSPIITVRKASQIGLSEIAARWVLALAAMSQGIQIIFTLPTAQFAGKFAKTRLDPIITNSPTLSGLVSSEVDSSLLKQIGTSFIHLAGSYSSSSPISIPAQALVMDEYDFSDQEILATYTSRLGHMAEDESLQIRFSTPTVEGFGISVLYGEGSQARYQVKCSHCGNWSAPSFLKDTVIPGYDKDLREWSKADVKNPRYDLKKAYLSCPNCKKDLQSSLIEPERRQWVHAYPDRAKTHASFHVVPFDVPKINTAAKVLKSIEGYRKSANWFNFALGETHEDADSSFLLSVVDQYTTLPEQPPSVGHLGPCLLGLDVGKVVHLAIGRPTAVGVDVIYLARISAKDCPDGQLGPKVLDFIRRYRVVKSVIDAMPDFSTANYVVTHLPEGLSYGCYYKRQRSTAQLSHLNVKEQQGVLQVSRTESFNELCQAINRGVYRFPRSPEMTELRAHLANIKRTPVDEDGNAAGVEGQGAWVSTGPDHYAHAINYLNLARQLLEERGVFGGFAMPAMISGVRLKESL